MGGNGIDRRSQGAITAAVLALAVSLGAMGGPIAPGDTPTTTPRSAEPARGPGSASERRESERSTVRPAPPLPATVEGVSVVIQATAAIADVGTSIALTAEAAGGTPPYTFRWNDSDGSAGLGADFSEERAVPTAVVVRVGLTDFVGETASASLGLQFVPGPTASITMVPNVVDVGEPYGIELGIAGGIAPFNATLVGTGVVPNRTVLGGAGPFLFPGVAVSAGPQLVQVTVTDEDQQSSTVAATVGQAMVAPTLDLPATAVLAEAGVPVALEGRCLGGVPPVEWTVTPTGAVPGGSGGEGIAAADGTFRWTTVFPATGNESTAVWTRDATGDVATGAIDVEVVPPLLLVGPPTPTPPTAGSPWSLTATITGGVGPYEWTASATGDPELTGTLALPGNLTVAIPLGNVTSIGLRLSVTDGDGVEGNLSYSLAVSPASPGPSPAPPASSPVGEAATPLAIVLAIGAALAGYWVRSRRRNGAADAPETDPAEEVVERLLRGAEGIDRETLADRAEADGVSAESVDEVLRRLRDAGRLTVVEGFDGEELFTLRAAPVVASDGGPE